MERMFKEYDVLYNIFSSGYSEVNGFDFYRELFPDNENKGELNSDYSKPNAIYLYRDDKNKGTKRQLSRRIMLKDTWENDYMEYVEGNDKAICGGLTYRRRANNLANAQRMNALIFDLDSVGENELRTLFLRFEKGPEVIRSLPVPTFIALSGTGLHLYYFMKEPVDLYPNIKLQLKSLKHDLTFKMWDYKSTTMEKQIQYQSINQAYRMVGSVNEKHGNIIRAFRTGEKLSLDELNRYVIDENNKVDINKPFRPSIMTRAEAKEKYPEWYERVIVNGDKRQKKWDIKGKQGFALYDWWRNKAGQIQGGHRYFFMMCMAIYACKCDVPKKKLRKDMEEAFNILVSAEHKNPLTMDDIRSAMEAYDKEYYNFTIEDIEFLTNIRIEKNKRNGRKQEVHLARARAVQDIDYPNHEWAGRPKGSGTAEKKVREWRELHPEGKKIDCERETGLSRHTVLKWWDKASEEQNR